MTGSYYLNIKKTQMKSNLFQIKHFLVLFLVFLTIGSLSSKDVFIRQNASGTGADWENAANISYLGGSGIADGDVIHVAAGDYLRTTQISISKYVTVLGGYSVTSTGIDITKRDIVANKSIFKPDAGSTSRAININAITASGGNKITLDGLYFEGFSGIAQGAAMTITTAQGDIDLKNLTFINNVTTNTTGGALAMQTAFAYDIVVTLDGCTFEGNQSNWTTGNGYGGAFYFNNGTTPKTINIKNSTFKNNYAYGRGAVGYFGTNMNVNITDCFFDSNQCTATTDNYSNGGCFYVVGANGYGSTFNVTRSIFLNSLVTGKGSVIWFNNTTGSLINNLNMTNCSLIGNYSSRTTSGRAAIDVDNYTAQMQFTLNGCVLSNYNNAGTTKGSRYADVMFVSFANTSNSSTFTNTIANGTHFATGNVLLAITPPDTLYNKQRGYLADSTINLALSGDLKITDKIVFKKTFTTANAGNYIHNQIFDIKKKMNFPMTLIATIPSGFALSVDGVDYLSGVQTVQIPTASTDPLISLKITSGITRPETPTAKIHAANGQIYVSDIDFKSSLSAYNSAGQLIHEGVVNNGKYNFSATGFVIVKLSNSTKYQTLKVISK
jgi:hypothetical protein